MITLNIIIFHWYFKLDMLKYSIILISGCLTLGNESRKDPLLYYFKFEKGSLYYYNILRTCPGDLWVTFVQLQI